MYTEKVMDHFQNPRNVGEIENASGVGTVGNAKCGDIMRIYLDIDENHHIKGMYVTPQMISEIKGGRASVKATGEPDQYIPCDILVVAIGQNIETEHFAEAGIPVERGKIVTTAGGDFLDMPGVFAGGDCASGPATVIKAIAAAKVVAANIDEYLGYHHEISCDVEIPKASLHDRVPCGRAELTEREACERVCDFEGVENCMTEKEAKQDIFSHASFR